MASFIDKIRNGFQRLDNLIRQLNRLPGRFTQMERDINRISETLDVHARETRLKLNELNLSSNAGTVDHNETVLFRRLDFEALALRLTEQGHHVTPFDYDPGTDPLDRYIDVPPIGRNITSQWRSGAFRPHRSGIIIQRGG